MCAVSQIIGYGQGFERPMTADEWEEFNRLLDAARRFDDRTGQPDCSDPTKDAWLVEEATRQAKEAES